MIAAAGVVVAVIAIPNASVWVIVGAVVVVIVGLLMIGWGTLSKNTDHPPPTATSFIKGSFENSSMDGIESEADTFIDGAVQKSTLENVKHLRRRR